MVHVSLLCHRGARRGTPPKKVLACSGLCETRGSESLVSLIVIVSKCSFRLVWIVGAGDKSGYTSRFCNRIPTWPGHRETIRYSNPRRYPTAQLSIHPETNRDSRSSL